MVADLRMAAPSLEDYLGEVAVWTGSPVAELAALLRLDRPSPAEFARVRAGAAAPDCVVRDLVAPSSGPTQSAEGRLRLAGPARSGRPRDPMVPRPETAASVRRKEKRAP